MASNNKTKRRSLLLFVNLAFVLIWTCCSIWLNRIQIRELSSTTTVTSERSSRRSNLRDLTRDTFSNNDSNTTTVQEVPDGISREVVHTDSDVDSPLSVQSHPDDSTAFTAVGAIPPTETTIETTATIAQASVTAALATTSDTTTTATSLLPPKSTAENKLHLLQGYQPGPMCGGCFLSVVVQKPLKTCGDLIQAQLDQIAPTVAPNSVTGKKEIGRYTVDQIVQAGILVAQQDPDHCHRCDPSHCDNDTEKKFVRMDHAGMNENWARSPMVSSIPEEYRLPIEAVQDPVAFFADETNKMTHRHYLFEYNPTVVPIPFDQIPAPYNTVAGHDRPVYLASFRISNFQDLFGETMIDYVGGRNGKLFQHDPFQIAFALLRADLTVITDGVFSMPPRVGLGDYRLFNFNEQLYVTVGINITKLWLVHQETTTQSMTFLESAQRGSVAILRDAYNPLGNNFTLQMSLQTSCCTTDLCNGKNFNYFSIPATDSTEEAQIYVEHRPVEPHFVEPVNVSQSCDEARKQRLETDYSLISYDPTPIHNRSSFFTIDESYFGNRGIFGMPYTQHRGSACCVSVDTPSMALHGTGATTASPTLLVGVSHRKIPLYHRNWRENNQLNFTIRQYTNILYAFEPFPPFRIVAVSGNFCPGFTQPSDESDNYLVNLTRGQPYTIGEDIMECPFITFISGIVESATDPSKFILSYGINDCMSRFVEYDKAELVRLLFHPFQATEMVVL